MACPRRLEAKNISQTGQVPTDWLLLFPALFMAVTLFSFNFIGDGLRDALDPKDR